MDSRHSPLASLAHEVGNDGGQDVRASDIPTFDITHDRVDDGGGRWYHISFHA